MLTPEKETQLIKYGFTKTTLFGFDEWWINPKTNQAMKPQAAWDLISESVWADWYLGET